MNATTADMLSYWRKCLFVFSVCDHVDLTLMGYNICVQCICVHTGNYSLRSHIVNMLSCAGSIYARSKRDVCSWSPMSKPIEGIEIQAPSSTAWSLNTGPDQRAVSLRLTTLFPLVPEMTLTISRQIVISGTNVDEYIPGINGIS